ncbi:MAG: hypothetical protein AAF356_00640 [Planctomycetota bacterium]
MIVELAHLLATAAMGGLIWFVQIVHYPLFARVGEADRVAYSRFHQTRTTFVVAPLMLAEAITAVWLLLRPPPGVDPVLTFAGITCLAAAWVSTAAVQVPDHGRLGDPASSPDIVRQAAKRLVWTNWVRTLLWSVRTLIAGMIVLHAAA